MPVCGMKRSAEAAWERAMKVQEVILRAIAKQITWWQAAEIIGISDRQLRRWQRRYEEHGYTGLIDRRRGARLGKTGTVGHGGKGVAVVPGAILRLQRAALSREVSSAA